MVVSNVIKYCSIFYQVDESQVIKPFPVTTGYVNCPGIWCHKFYSSKHGCMSDCLATERLIRSKGFLQLFSTLPYSYTP